MGEPAPSVHVRLPAGTGVTVLGPAGVAVETAAVWEGAGVPLTAGDASGAPGSVGAGGWVGLGGAWVEVDSSPAWVGATAVAVGVGAPAHPTASAARQISSVDRQAAGLWRNQVGAFNKHLPYLQVPNAPTFAFNATGVGLGLL